MIEVTKVVGLVTVQDLGARGHMHEAVPHGGALVPELLVAANRGVDNADHAAVFEVMGQLTIQAWEQIVIAVDDQPPRIVDATNEITVSSGSRRCTYVAVRGGISKPGMYGGNGTLLCGGVDTPVSTGTVYVTATLHADRRARATFADTNTIELVAGPDSDAFDERVLDMLTSAPYRISSSSNRVGTRLEGAALPRRADYRERSRPMVKGALEVPRDGLPIVLGPEHPTTGGYPIVAVIAAAELGRFFSIRLGGQVSFRLRAPARS